MEVYGIGHNVKSAVRVSFKIGKFGKFAVMFEKLLEAEEVEGCFLCNKQRQQVSRHTPNHDCT
jgi:hypothetical protein